MKSLVDIYNKTIFIIGVITTGFLACLVGLSVLVIAAIYSMFKVIVLLVLLIISIIVSAFT